MQSPLWCLSSGSPSQVSGAASDGLSDCQSCRVLRGAHVANVCNGMINAPAVCHTAVVAKSSKIQLIVYDRASIHSHVFILVAESGLWPFILLADVRRSLGQLEICAGISGNPLCKAENLHCLDNYIKTLCRGRFIGV